MTIYVTKLSNDFGTVYIIILICSVTIRVITIFSGARSSHVMCIVRTNRANAAYAIRYKRKPAQTHNKGGPLQAKRHEQDREGGDGTCTPRLPRSTSLEYFGIFVPLLTVPSESE